VNVLVVLFAILAGVAGSVQVAVMSKLGDRVGVLGALAWATSLAALLAIALMLVARQSFGEFTALDEVLSAGLSRCGQTVVWRANTALSVRNTKASSFSMASIDTVDVHNQRFVTFNLGTRPCR